MTLLPKLLPLFITAAMLAGCSTESVELTPETIRPVKLLEISDINAASMREFPG